MTSAPLEPPRPPQRTVNQRDRGLRRIASMNRWLIAGAIGLSGFFTTVAALAKPGRHATSSAPASSTSPSATTDSSQSSSTDSTQSSTPQPSSSQGGDSSQAVQPPAQAPQPSTAPAPVASGGS